MSLFISLWRGAQFPVARSMWRLNLVRWRLIFEGPQCRTSCIVTFWCLEFYRGAQLLVPRILPWCPDFSRHLWTPDLWFI